MTNHTHNFAQWPFADAVNTAAFCTERVAREAYPVLWVSHEDNGDWEFFDGTTDDPG